MEINEGGEHQTKQARARAVIVEFRERARIRNSDYLGRPSAIWAFGNPTYNGGRAGGSRICCPPSFDAQSGRKRPVRAFGGPADVFGHHEDYVSPGWEERAQRRVGGEILPRLCPNLEATNASFGRDGQPGRGKQPGERGQGRKWKRRKRTGPRASAFTHANTTQPTQPPPSRNNAPSTEGRAINRIAATRMRPESIPYGYRLQFPL
ncbi:hypothetical protein C8F04DRAFT_1180754 [Mycena alexandri]|uniref:Uncharacterized protein n=1 Tax=Mycena alexandri TaxID=1745969 RepID=A0AAD6X2Y5_9AGAR|nr:hypothetical protein C8F04DRAFT_1180754 [Mycena alexandri]